MAAKAPYMPDAQVEFDQWLDNFSTLLSAEPLRYGLVEEEAAVIAETRASGRPPISPPRPLDEEQSLGRRQAGRPRHGRKHGPPLRPADRQQHGDFADRQSRPGPQPAKHRADRIKPPARGPLLAVKKVDHLSVTLVYSRLGTASRAARSRRA